MACYKDICLNGRKSHWTELEKQQKNALSKLLEQGDPNVFMEIEMCLFQQWSSEGYRKSWGGKLFESQCHLKLLLLLSSCSAGPQAPSCMCLTHGKGESKWFPLKDGIPYSAHRAASCSHWPCLERLGSVVKKACGP